jgi:hypothetical protein
MRNERLHKSLTAFLFLLLTPLALFAQGGAASSPKPLTMDQFVGSYKGTAKRAGSDISVALEVKFENGKAAGRLTAPDHPELQITSGEIAENKLTLKLNSAANAATLVLQALDDKLVGEWRSGEQSGPVEFKRVPAEPSAAEMLSGDWDGAADVQGQAFPFNLTLKVEGDKVTGSSSSQLGTSTITAGTWQDGKLAFVLDSPSGQIAMIATLVEGKLIGDYDFSGQTQGKWVATKRK